MEYQFYPESKFRDHMENFSYGKNGAFFSILRKL